MAHSSPETSGAGLHGASGLAGERRAAVPGSGSQQGGSSGAGRRLALALVRLLVAGGLAVDSYVHFDLAGAYSEAGGVISEGVLFRAEAVAALLVAIVVAVAASALAAMLVARYVDIGAIGPFPDLYEPVWFPEKAFAVIGEGMAGPAAAAGIALLWTTRKARPRWAPGQKG